VGTGGMVVVEATGVGQGGSTAVICRWGQLSEN
jgi:hypothetical protein